MIDAINNWDIGILLYIQEHVRMPFLDGLMKVITMLGDAGWFWIALTVILCVPKKTRKAGVIASIALLMGVIITNICLKNAVGRIRPYDLCEALNPIIKRPKDFSFPSGHTTASMAAAFAYLKELPKKAGIPLLVLALLISFSRLYVGVHYPTDVIAAVLVALIAFLIGLLVTNLIYKKVEEKKQLVLEEK